MLVRTRARLAIKIGSKLSLCPYTHFTEHLVGAFGKSPRESELKLSFSIQQQHQLHPATNHTNTSKNYGQQ
jgi:hypothetical protein